VPLEDHPQPRPGEHDGVAFLAMEVVEGQGLDELLLAGGTYSRLYEAWITSTAATV